MFFVGATGAVLVFPSPGHPLQLHHGPPGGRGAAPLRRAGAAGGAGAPPGLPGRLRWGRVKCVRVKMSHHQTAGFSQLVSVCQGKPFWAHIFDPHPNPNDVISLL